MSLEVMGGVADYTEVPVVANEVALRPAVGHNLDGEGVEGVT
jgi:hypothetical protein